jgi:hypothetical protein
LKLLFENWRGYLKEIGEASLEPYDFNQVYDTDEEVRYVFVSGDLTAAAARFPHTQGSEYVVKFTSGGVSAINDVWDISFEANATIAETGEDQPLKIMSTVVAIVKDFIERPELSRGLRKFVFQGIHKDIRNKPPQGGQTQRTKLYLRFLKKNMPAGTKIREAGENVIFFELPADDSEEELDENDYPITSQRANKEINQVITPTKKKNAQTKLPGWKQLKSNYKGSAPPGAGGS